MKFKGLFAAALLSLASTPSMATIINVFDLGNLGVPSATLIGNAFYAGGEYEDRYNFTIGESANASGLVLEIDPLLNKLDIDVTSVALTGTGGLLGLDVSPFYYNFGALSAGSYTLSIFSSVSRDRGLYHSAVGYGGLLTLKRTEATQVPEPGTLALFGMSLIGVAVATRRRKVLKPDL